MIIKTKLTGLNKKYGINLTIGAFDAFHKGHMKILNILTQRSKYDKVKSAVITFQNRPKHVLNKNNDGIIFSNQARALFFKEEKIDYLFFLNFTEKFANIKAEDFIKNLTVLFNLNKIVIGCDFKFGKGNRGDIFTLKKYQVKYGFKLLAVPILKSGGKKISSTLIKSLIREGNFKEVNTLLGREYYINGKVIRGKARGRKIGFPTVNILPESRDLVLPSPGVYLSKIYYKGDFYYGMTYIGLNHFTGKFVIETHIYGFKESIYDEKIRIFFIKKLRNEIKFITLEQLRNQLLLDMKKAKKILEEI